MSDVRNPEQFFHQSNKKFRVGEEVKPAAETGYRSRWRGDPRYRKDRVYVTSREDAPGIQFGAFGEHLYEVEPHGSLEPDPERDSKTWPIPEDDPAGFSFMAERARVKRKIY